MLIITRKQGESIIIDLGSESIELTVTDIGKQVRLGISAPDGYKIWRKELYTTMQENRHAVQEGAPPNIKDILKQIKSQSSK